MKILLMLLFSGCMVPQLYATEEIEPAENDILVAFDASDTEQPADDVNVAANPNSVDEFRTSVDKNNVEHAQSIRTSLGLEDVDETPGDVVEEEDVDESLGDVVEEDAAAEVLHSSSPLDWSTLDQGLQDLHNLINQIDEMAPNRTNSSVENEETSEDSSGKPKYPCAPRQVGNDTSATNVTAAQTRIVNATELLELVTSKADITPAATDNSTNTTDGHCVFVMFYAPWCKFSVASAPHFNAIGRAFADIDVIAVDAFQFRSLNARYGTVSVPNFLFFYNNKPVLRYNYSERNFDSFVEFLQNHTGMVANSSVNVSDVDFGGPVPSVISEEPDYALWFSGIFLLGWFMWLLKVQCGTVIATKIDGGVNYMRHIWRTGEFYEQVGMLDHEHVD